MIELPFYMKTAFKSFDLMQAQDRTGVLFDLEGAKKLVIKIDQMMEDIRAEVEPQLPPKTPNQTELKSMTPPKNQFKKDGTPSKLCEEWFDDVHETVGGCGIGWVGKRGGKQYPLPHNEPILTPLPMKLSNQKELKAWLVSLGWKPLYFNYKQERIKGKMQKVRDAKGKLIPTSPKFQENGKICPSLESMDSISLVKPIITWLSLRNRRSVLLNESKGTGILNNPRLPRDGRISASSAGLTNTFRQKHRGVVNIPRPSSLLGGEFRDLFICQDDKVLVGYDATGLEARLKGHYVFKYDKGEYVNKILSGDYDEHQESADLWGIPRTKAKNGNYALQYFCMPPTLAKTIGCSVKEAEEYWHSYWDLNWALDKFKQDCERFWKTNGKSFVYTIDKSKVMTRSQHTLVNCRIQSTGALIMDLAGIFMNKWVKERCIQGAHRVIYYHDEYLWECFPQDAELISYLGIKSIKKAGEYFKLNVPLDADAKIGRSWKECH